MSISNQISKMSVFLGKCCGVFYFTAILLSVYEVFLRYFLKKPTAWGFETIMILVGLAWLMSIGAITQQNRHITVTFLEIIVPKKVWKIMQKIAILLSLAAVAGLLWASLPPALHALQHIERSGTAFNPASPSLIKAMLAVACVIYILQLLVNLFKSSEETLNEIQLSTSKTKTRR